MATNQIEKENQEVMIETLKSEMAEWECPFDIAKPHYIPTSEYANRTGPGTWTDGIEFRMLGEETVAWRTGGDWRDNGDWQISTIEDFRAAVVADAEETLASWIDEDQD